MSQRSLVGAVGREAAMTAPSRAGLGRIPRVMGRLARVESCRGAVWSPLRSSDSHCCFLAICRVVACEMGNDNIRLGASESIPQGLLVRP